MTGTLKEFIDRRKNELLAEIEQLKSRIMAIESELKELNLVESSLSLQQSKSQLTKESFRSKRLIQSNTIKAEIIRILYSRNIPMLALDILHIINSGRNPPLERTSLSPQLSRLKADGILKLDGSEWSLTEKGNEEAMYL
jgi:hypothetical protein